MFNVEQVIGDMNYLWEEITLNSTKKVQKEFLPEYEIILTLERETVCHIGEFSYLKISTRNSEQ